MANKDPSKTEKATPKKLDESRKEGKVMTSQDVTSLVMALGGSLLILIMGPMLKDAFVNTLNIIADSDCRQSWNVEVVQHGILIGALITGKILIPFTLALCLLAIIIMRVQVGKYFSLKALKWKVSSFNPKSSMMSLFPSKQNLIKLLLTLSKVVLIGYFVYLSLRADYDELPRLILIPLSKSAEWLAQRSYLLLFKTLSLFAVIAAIDYIVKRKKYNDDLMMTKQEVKTERKNAEGDPLIKGKIRQKMRQLLRAAMMSSVPSADVIITNPTHVAVALRYEFGTQAPKVVAKGLRKTALRIRRSAQMHGIPIVEAPPLARSLYRNTEVGQYIDPEFYGAVAAILAKLHNSGKKTFA